MKKTYKVKLALQRGVLKPQEAELMQLYYITCMHCGKTIFLTNKKDKNVLMKWKNQNIPKKKKS